MDPMSTGTWDWIADALKGVWGLVLTLLGFIGFRAHRALDKHEEKIADLDRDKADTTAVDKLEETIMRRLDRMEDKQDSRHSENTKLLGQLVSKIRGE